ncbi:MAG TPA: tetratricopeptide repeat protein [Chloroflexi bacterium]|nr:tetratricopeptide repeat protein [Chloroflexota bacterium]
MRIRIGLPLKMVIAILMAITLGSGYKEGLITAWLRLSALHEGSNEYSLAVKACENALALAPYASPLYMRLGEIYLKQGRYDLAEGAFALAFRYNSGLTAVTKWGDVLFARGEVEEALEKWRKALRLNPADAGLHYRVGLALMRIGRLEDAIVEVERALPEIPQAHCLLALLKAPQSPDAALAHAERCELPAWKGWPWLPLEVQDLKELEEILTEPSETARLMGLGGLYLRLGEPHLAERTFLKATVQTPGSPEAQAYLGYARSLLGKDPEPEFARALRLKYTLPLTHYLWGLHLKSRGKLEAAAQEFAYALSQDPENPAYCAALADVALMRGDYREAERWYRKATDLAPDEPGFWLLLAQFYVDVLLRGDQEAIGAAQEAINLAPDNPKAYELLGRAYYYSGRSDLALHYLQKSLQLAPVWACGPEPEGEGTALTPIGPCLSPEALRIMYYLGTVYASRGEREAALELFHRIQELAPDSQWAEKARGVERHLGVNTF